MQQTRYQIINHSFSLALDDGWQDQTLYRFAGPEFDGLLHYINIGVDNVMTTLTLRDYAGTYIQSLQDTLHNFKMLKQGEMTMLDKHSAYEIVYQWLPDKKTKLIQRSLFTIKDQRMHILSTSFTRKSWNKLHSTIDTMMRSFH